MNVAIGLQCFASRMPTTSRPQMVEPKLHGTRPVSREIFFESSALNFAFINT